MAKPGRILIVDDDPIIIRIVALALKGHDYDIHSASNGREGIKKALALQPDLMILDIMMPGDLDGYEVCQRIKSDPSTSHIRVLMFTARGNIDSKSVTHKLYTESLRERLLGLEVGADDFLSKPVQVKQLVARVQKLL